MDDDRQYEKEPEVIQADPFAPQKQSAGGYTYTGAKLPEINASNDPFSRQTTAEPDVSVPWSRQTTSDSTAPSEKAQEAEVKKEITPKSDKVRRRACIMRFRQSLALKSKFRFNVVRGMAFLT